MNARFLARLLLAACLAASLPGCGSLYLHSDAAGQATAQAKVELDKVDVAAVFDNEAAYLDDLQKREYAAVAEAAGTERDEDLLEMLHGRKTRKAGDGDGRIFMAMRIDGYLQDLVGSSDRGDGAKLDRIVASAHQRVNGNKPLADALAEMLASDFGRVRSPGGVAFALVPSPGGTTLDQAIRAAKAATDERVAKQASAKAGQADLKQKLDAATKELESKSTSQAAFDAFLAKVHELLEKAKAENNPYLKAFASKSFSELLDEIIEVTDPKGIEQPSDSKARAALSFLHAAFGAADAFASPARTPHPFTLAAAKAWLRYRAGEHELEVERARANETFANARLVAVADSVYYLSLAGQELQPMLEGSERAPVPAAANEQGFARLLADPKLQRGATASLHYFSAAWNEGFIPVRQLNQVAHPLIERRARLHASRQAGDAWLNTLKPAVASLDAYGQGGIDPRVIAELLQTLGIGAVAVGVN